MHRESPEEMHARWRTDWTERPEIQQLLASPHFSEAMQLLEGKRRLKAIGDRQLDLDMWVMQSVGSSLREPDLADTMTASERNKLADTITQATETLRNSLEIFRGQYGFKYPFQGNFDRVALDVALDDEERLREVGVSVDEDTVHRCRYAVYRLLMYRMDWMFDAITESAESFKNTETIIKKPNDPNARRLYFLRVITRKFCMEFRSPCRGAALALASIYFDCTDLDEAAISKLAPVPPKPKPLEISREDFEQLKVRVAEMGGDPSLLDEAVAEAESNWGRIKKSSA